MDTRHYDEHVPVLIVGGSLVGLSMALFLSGQGIRCLLVERHPGVSPFTRASGFNPRTMEMYRAFGVESAIKQAEPQRESSVMILQVESLMGKELGSYTQKVSDFDSPASPAQMSFITQDRLEPILRTHAEKLGGDLRFHTQLLSSEQDADGVTAIIRDNASGEERTVRARYLIAADGNDSPLRQRLGIATHGPGTLAHQMFVIFKADLRPALRGRPIFFCYVINQQIQGGAIGAAPDRLGGMLNVPYDPAKGESKETFTDARCKELVRSAVGDPDLDVEIVSRRSWELAALVAERFQQGRIFLVGDAAHVMPPTGGYGANTGIADAHNLAWKLALVLKGIASPQLLATYDAERRPVAQFTVEQAYGNFVERMAPHLADTITAPKVDYYTVIFGYHYNDEKLYDNPYQPTGKPGVRAPHIVLERDGKCLSTVDLFNRQFVLLSGVAGHAWQEAARKIREQYGIELSCYSIGTGSDLVDVHGDFLSTYGLSRDGAVLVRPDGFIMWRSETAGEDAERDLAQSFVCLFGR
jgi:2-polyprenyl-6-methoxyphenol hydroxylase-like FAD-dependent oxidoreductase